MKKILFITLAVAFLAAIAWIALPEKVVEASSKPSKAQRIEEAMKDNFERTKDWELGYPPVERLVKAMKQTRAMQVELAKEKDGLAKVRFQERGPNNIGGRTRTIMVDKNDPSGKTVWAGAVSGGVWKTNDITATDPQWISYGDDFANLTVGSMVQDPSNPQIIYIGTGELYAGGTNSFVGYGIFRSTDGGETWASIPSTIEGVQASAFQFTNDMLVLDDGTLYVATYQGLFRSFNQGDNWERVLNGSAHEIEYGSNGMLIAAMQGTVFRSSTGNEFEWENLSGKEGFPRNLQRMETSVCKSDPNVIYLLGSSGGDASDIYRSTNGGDTWQKRGIPQSVEGIPNFTRGQAFYDLTIAVDPYDCNRLVVGGIDLFRSFDGGFSWNQIAHWFGGYGLQYVHADQHIAVYDEDRRDVLYFGNDGGIFRSTDGGTDAPSRVFGYNVTQFYAGDIHPEAYRNFYIGGTQDNGSLRLDDDEAISSAVEVRGGDGFFAHIDQNDPRYQMVSLYFADYALSTNEGKTFGGGASLNGNFVSASDYDDAAKILYSQTNDGDLYRWPVLGDGDVTLMDVEGANISVSAVHVDKNTPNRVYVGSFGGELYRIDNAHTGTIYPENLLHDFDGTISSIYVEPRNPDRILVTTSNYGRNRVNVFESRNGGESWIDSEGNLPDMPVRGGLFLPDGSGGAAIATELGVWFTEKLEGDNTVWLPPTLDGGIPMVRTDMLQLRASDNVILAITYGRGMFTTDVFARPKAVLAVEEITYQDVPLVFDGNASFGAEKYLWDLGDGTTSTERFFTHQYEDIGEYKVTLTINDTLSDTRTVKVLPDRTLPYTEKEPGYSGGFEGFEDDYGVFTIFGTPFERGQSAIRGKDGTHSGANAFVVGIEEDFYENNTHTMLYLPNFDFSEPGIYEFSFWSKAFIKGGFHGYNVEYSLDKGRSWRSLVDEKLPNWYSYTNETLENAPFPQGSSYFGLSKSDWEQSFVDISQLAGQENVAFRFVFKASDTGNFPGIAIDDVQITRYEGKLETDIVAANAEYVSSESARITWTTQPEYYADEFIVERSFNGRDFEPLANGKVDAIGRVSGRVTNYSLETQGIRNLYFFRIRSINENTGRDYYYEFETPVMSISRDLEPNDLYRIFPNPFTDHLNLTFTNFIETPLEVELYDASGKLLLQEIQEVAGVHLRLETGDLPKGVYFLRYKIGETEAKIERLMRQ